MYQIKNKIYADAGYVLKYKDNLGFNFRDIDIKDVSEIKINLNNMKIKGRYILYSEGLKEYISCTDYNCWKTKFIHKQFTNDDQLAIILNKDYSEEDLLLYDKMQEWRDWSGKFAKKVIELWQQ